MGRILDRFNLIRAINGQRRALGLHPVRDAWAHVLGENVIVASDKAISEVPPDVAPACHQSGYMHMDHNVQDHVRDFPELESFLKAGLPPLYAGFGSMPKQDQAGNVSVILEAARSCGQRVVIAKFWDEPAEQTPSDDLFFIKRYPHLELFPRMAAVIHHGGAGTTASSAISGVPQIIVPHALDQYYWGHQVYRSRLGPKPIWRSGLNAKRLSSAIRETLSNAEIKRKAIAVSERIKRENGLDLTVREVLNI
jgi:UDP:flavonoid glycosyltransferase YjiC (YdhE family)